MIYEGEYFIDIDDLMKRNNIITKLKKKLDFT